MEVLQKQLEKLVISHEYSKTENARLLNNVQNETFYTGLH
jgi:hypothetical protein